MDEKRTEYVYGHLLEAITGGLYPNKLDVVREYVQNSYDSIREVVKLQPTIEEKSELLSKLKIDIYVDANSLFIYDNATGMDYETLNEYRKIGYSKKTYGEYAGWRGIGKAAGLSVSEKLIVTTSIGKGETYQLTFNAQKMLDEVYTLRERGDNILFSILIDKHSEINTIEGGDQSFTLVELHNIKSDSVVLLNEDKLATHLSLLTPIPFDPEFNFKATIEDELMMALDDYLPINLFIRGTQIFKPYNQNWTDINGQEFSVQTPSFLPVYDETGEELLAFCWFCMNQGSGQLYSNIQCKGDEWVPIGGLVYRIDDIKIGNPNLTRGSLWTSSSHLAYYALGEIHIIDNSVEPTSDRNDFIDNYGRYRLFDKGKTIAKEISRKARKASKESVATKKINLVSEKIEKISEKVSNKEIHKETLSTYIYQVHDLRAEAIKRKPDTPEEDLKQKADRVVSLSDVLLVQLTNAIETPQTEEKIYIDILEELDLNEESRQVYSVIINILRDFYANEPIVYEQLIARIVTALEDAFSE